MKYKIELINVKEAELTILETAYCENAITAAGISEYYQKTYKRDFAYVRISVYDYAHVYTRECEE